MTPPGKNYYALIRSRRLIQLLAALVLSAVAYYVTSTSYSVNDAHRLTPALAWADKPASAFAATNETSLLSGTAAADEGPSDPGSPPLTNEAPPRLNSAAVAAAAAALQDPLEALGCLNSHNRPFGTLHDARPSEVESYREYFTDHVQGWGERRPNMAPTPPPAIGPSPR